MGPEYRDRSLTKPLGRPARPYDPEIAEIICLEIATSAKGLSRICKEHAERDDPADRASGLGFPSIDTVLKWLNSNADFSQAYSRAKELQADFLADEIIEISDDAGGDAVIRYRGGKQVAEIDGTNVNRSRLMVDSRKWLAAKLRPKKYGDQLDVTSGGEPLPAPSSVAIDARVQTLMMLAQRRQQDAQEAQKLLDD